MARRKESLAGVVIEDLQEAQVRAADALALAEQGIVVPEQHIYYNDEDIAYDPDFDEGEWGEEPLDMTSPNPHRDLSLGAINRTYGTVGSLLVFMLPIMRPYGTSTT